MDQAYLQRIENDREITFDSDSEFLYTYQMAVLLCLGASGHLTETQVQYAIEKLRRERIAYAAKKSFRTMKEPSC